MYILLDSTTSLHDGNNDDVAPTNVALWRSWT